ncbi:protein tyrosine phosphatase domain-containing protein 1 isoform X1 [Scleropages formosus]|uniref:Protein tyrosine phosphatase domain-containing protein 1 n=1 Tax=Scleropages formosus TaxID=113540 RepID=A0A8C9S287_SCLFO|nr:protein tyrosine phosphatase domain-containing protein 1-like isoform X1 [Scleropages formosus]
MAAGISLHSDLPHAMHKVSIVESTQGTEMEMVSVRVPTAKYTKVGETLRHVIPGHMQCSMTCGGRACKYENPSRWSEEEQAIKGLYSSWITDNLLAMARPSTEIIQKYNIIDQFQDCGLRTVINLQRPGEHASCGNPLEPESGFTYRPEIFMEASIYFYNFGWKDYGVASLTTILDMVKVMSFAIQEGKVAVHCHAGLGRTGVLIACYLVFTTRMSADQAILFVRAKRPNSIQTRGQLLCVREFAQFLVPLRSVFSCAEPRTNAVTLAQYLTRQRHLLHGYEARRLKHVPKVVQLVCKALLDVAEGRQASQEEVLEIPDLTAEVEKTVSQQAIQQLGKEMMGKGIAVVQACLSDPPTLAKLPSAALHNMWTRDDVDNNQPSFCLRKTHSYSDSDLQGLASMLTWAESPLNLLVCQPFSGIPDKLRLSQSDVTEVCVSADLHFLPVLSVHQASGSNPSPDLFPTPPWEAKARPSVADSSPLFRRRRKPLSESQRSMSLGSWGRGHPPAVKSVVPAWLTEHRAEVPPDPDGLSSAADHLATNTMGDDGDNRSEVPLITVHTELPLEARRLLVAQALSLDLDQDGKEYRHKVLKWQTELNSREGAWDRMCNERDPFVLSGLLWSWLEQLKEPVLSKVDVLELSRHKSECYQDPQHALSCLDKGPRQTLLCILDCAAHVAEVPQELEDAFLQRTIKAFTKMRPSSDEGAAVYESLKAILAPVLHEMKRRAAGESQIMCQCLHGP